jgi:hypothetical protein
VSGLRDTPIEIVHAADAKALALLGVVVTFLHEPRDAEDSLLFENWVPAGAGVPAHTERNTEQFYVWKARSSSTSTARCTIAVRAISS